MPPQTAPVDPASLWKPVPPDDPTSLWKPVPDSAPTPTMAAQPTMAQRVGTMAGDIGKGLGESAISLMSTGDDFARKHLPAFMTNSNFGFGRPADEEHVHQMAAPVDTTQKVAKGLFDAAQFLIPGGAEEKAVSLLPSGLRTAGRIGAAALSSGLVNKAQGGGFGTGAAMGGIGGGMSEGLKAIAPGLAESALNIRKTDRAYKAPGAIGRAILDETRGFSPGAVAESAEGVLGKLNPELNAAADRASVRPAPKIRGFLQPPVTETPLHMAGGAEGRLSEPVWMTQTDRPTRPLLQAPSLQTPLSEKIHIFPDQLPESDTGIRPTFGEPVPGIRQAQYLGQIPGERGGPDQIQGVMRTRPQMSASIPATMEANPSASLRGARGELGNAFGTAARQGERSTMSQLGPMRTHLMEDVSGNPIPADVTPRQLLDLKRGFGNEFVHRWNPETMEGVKGTAGRVYHQMAQSFEDAVPEAGPLNRRIGALIPVAKRGESAELNAPTAQRAMHRIAAHTGAGIGAITGGYSGYRHGGVEGMLLGGMSGLLLPEIMAAPSTEMAIGRGFNSPLTKSALRLGGGIALQSEDKSKKAKNQ